MITIVSICNDYNWDELKNARLVERGLDGMIAILKSSPGVNIPETIIDYMKKNFGVEGVRSVKSNEPDDVFKEDPNDGLILNSIFAASAAEKHTVIHRPK